MPEIRAQQTIRPPRRRDSEGMSDVVPARLLRALSRLLGRPPSDWMGPDPASLAAERAAPPEDGEPSRGRLPARAPLARRSAGSRSGGTACSPSRPNPTGRRAPTASAWRRRAFSRFRCRRSGSRASTRSDATTRSARRPRRRPGPVLAAPRRAARGRASLADRERLDSRTGSRRLFRGSRSSSSPTTTATSTACASRACSPAPSGPTARSSWSTTGPRTARASFWRSSPAGTPTCGRSSSKRTAAFPRRPTPACLPPPAAT